MTSSGSAGSEAVRRMMPRRGARSAAAVETSAGASRATQLVAVTYSAQAAAAQKTALSTRESGLGAMVRQYTFSHAGLVTHVLQVPASQVASVEASLRAQPGVRTVGLTGTRRYPTSVTTPYFPNDPYFQGFPSPVPTASGGATPPTTFETGLEENSSVPGQWDMHVIRLEHAFGYSQANNGSSITNPAALGSSSVKIAVIDTGEDTTHPELHSKIVYQKCFITNVAGTKQSTSNFATDPDGHGTNVAGIAGADTNNALGFTGTGGNVELYGYRVFPTPDDSCSVDSSSNTSNDNQCGADTADIASAIEDAVARKVNVISMSLGGGQCNSDGSDPDPTEGGAVQDALAANIVLVAAAGNSAAPPSNDTAVEAPACDTYSAGSVIAVGATGLSDGSTNASENTTGSATSPTEYVASYSNHGSTGAVANSATAWGIVAPGGDPNGNSDTDDLHWIENTWTSTPFDSKFAGICTGDYPAESGTADCRTQIAGTSMSTPHVAGAAALIISVNPTTYQSPTAMKTLLCQTADDISDPNEGCGRLDVYRAMAAALGDTAAPGPSPIP